MYLCFVSSCRKDGYAWTYVSSHSKKLTLRDEAGDEDDVDEEAGGEDDVEEDEEDADRKMDEILLSNEESKLRRDWNALCKSGRSSVTYPAICKLAKENRCVLN